jgi:hypothetical protein
MSALSNSQVSICGRFVIASCVVLGILWSLVIARNSTTGLVAGLCQRHISQSLSTLVNFVGFGRLVKQLECERVAGNEENKDEPSVGNATMQNIHRSVATEGKSTSTSSARDITGAGSQERNAASGSEGDNDKRGKLPIKPTIGQ